MGSIDTGLLFWTLVTFGFLLAVLAKFAFKPLRKIMNEREQKIRESLNEAERAREEAKKLLVQNDDQIREARNEARKIISAGQKIVAAMKDEAQKSARDETELIINHARTEIDREVKRSLDDLKTTVVNLSSRIAKQVIKDNMDEKRQVELVEEFVEHLKQTHERGK